MPKVSVILTSYNRPNFLNDAIKSVMSQTMEDWELIIMDDNSPGEVVRNILNIYSVQPNIKVFISDISEEDRYKTARYSVLINEAVRKHATGRYITYLADDDYYYPQRLEVMSNYLDDHPEVAVVFSCQHIVDIDRNVRGARRFLEPLTKAWDTIDHNSVMHRVEVFHEVNGWEEGAYIWGGADAAFFRKLNDKGYLFYPVAPEVALDCKRYHENAVQWKIANNVFPGVS